MIKTVKKGFLKAHFLSVFARFGDKTERDGTAV